MGVQAEMAARREDRTMEVLIALARAGEPLPKARALSSMVGFSDKATSAYQVLVRLADQGRVTIEGRGSAKVVHLPELGLSLPSRLNPAGKPRRPVGSILATVARAACLDVSEITGPSRRMLHLRPRYVAAMLARAEGWPFESIAADLGRDRTALIDAVRRGEMLLCTDPLFARLHRRSAALLAGMPPAEIAIPPGAERARRRPDADDCATPDEMRDLWRRRQSSIALLNAIRREHPERMVA